MCGIGVWYLARYTVQWKLSRNAISGWVIAIYHLSDACVCSTMESFIYLIYVGMYKNVSLRLTVQVKIGGHHGRHFWSRMYPIPHTYLVCNLMAAFGIHNKIPRYNKNSLAVFGVS